MSTHNPLNELAYGSRGTKLSVENLVSPAEIAAAVGDDAPSPVQVLLSHARRACYAPQNVLYHQGNAPDTVFFITGGLLKLVAYLPNGRARIVRLHRPGSVLGLSGLRDLHNEHTAVAVTPVSALRLPIGALQRLRSDDPTTYIVLAERWHDYLRDADRWITQFSTGPIRSRVAHLLGFLSEFEPDAADGQVQLLTCEEMGSILGVTSESVSRILAQFKRQQILARNDSEAGEVYAADTARLRDIAAEN
jgi:CRP/FNR family transcriptional regulator, anaerobic regulatory protein